MSGRRPRHLIRRGATYHFRCRLPEKLASALAIAELSRSLHTREPAEARRRCLAATYWFAALIETLSKMPNPTRADLENAARRYFGQLAKAVDVPRGFDPDYVDQEVAYNIEMSDDRIRQLDFQLVSNEFDPLVHNEAGLLSEELGSTFAELPAELKGYALKLAARAEREKLQLLKHLLLKPTAPFSGDDLLFSQSQQPTSSVAASPQNQSETAGPSLADLVREYTRHMHQRQLGLSHVDEVGRVLQWMLEVLGHDQDINSVTRADARKFRDDICRMDRALRGQGRPFSERLTSITDRQIKSATSTKYWRSVSAFFNWAHSEFDEVKTNPAEGLILKPKKGEQPSTPKPYSPDELQRLFKTPLYAGYLSNHRLATPGSCIRREGRWWAGVIMPLTGLRAGELSQLLPTDFMFDHPVPHLKVRREDGSGKDTKQTKNNASVRDLPLHPVLLQLGLQEFVTLRGSRYPKDRLFREFRLGTRGKISDGMTKFWSHYTKKFDLWLPGRSTHVWRHTVVACLRTNGATNEDIGALVGHAPDTMTGQYGGDQPLTRKLKTLEKLDYGFDLLHLLGGPWNKKVHW
ncbi:DUF6538 domain-containing protein [Blastomonas sp.]|uniref:DUF6538 domain-containing protein n=1 Tax=Blastomonas sp. TaxID=1909299 RepID=UPI00345C900F